MQSSSRANGQAGSPTATTASISGSSTPSGLGAQRVVAPSRRWRVVDIVVASVIGVASGLIFWAWGLATNVIGVAFDFLPGLSGILGGGWLFAGVLGGLIIRKPGAALYTELLAAVVSAVVGTQWGYLTLVSGLVQGIGAELVFAVFLYANWRLSGAILAGVGAGLALAINDLILWYPGTDALFKTVYVVTSLVSGAVLAGVLSWLAVRGLASSGALSRFAAGRESRSGEVESRSGEVASGPGEGSPVAGR